MEWLHCGEFSDPKLPLIFEIVRRADIAWSAAGCGCTGAVGAPGCISTGHSYARCGVQAGRPITVVPATPVDMQRAILNPLSMGSRARYVLMLGVQVRHLP